MRASHWFIATTTAAALTIASSHAAAPKFYPDDPLPREPETQDASRAVNSDVDLFSDLLINLFMKPGDVTPGVRAGNINTIDEVPDSSWFTNRIGVRDLPIAEITRGPSKFERLDATDWTIVRGKSPGGFHPGFVAQHPGDPGQVYQLEVDHVDHPQMATGAELIGTLVYHALGYHTEDVYAIRVDPARITISDKATIRDSSGRRRSTWRQSPSTVPARVPGRH